MPDERESSGLESHLRRLIERDLGAQLERMEPLSAGLGLRRFYRLLLAGAPWPSAVARVESHEDPAGRPPGLAPEPPLEPLRSHLERCGLPVPARLAGDEAAGIEILEDVGDRTLRDAAAVGAEERRALYAEACNLVPRLQRVPDPGGLPAFRRQLDETLFAYKADLFTRESLGHTPTPGETRAISEAFYLVAEHAAAAPKRLAHRDFQSANLHTCGPRSRPSLVMIDLQGAFQAPPEYDLVCLLRDSYFELPEPEVEEHLATVRPVLPDCPDAETFRLRFDLLTLTRKGKDHARYCYAARERGDTRYLAYVPAAVRALQRAAQRVAALDARLSRLAEIIETLPESPSCAP